MAFSHAQTQTIFIIRSRDGSLQTRTSSPIPKRRKKQGLLCLLGNLSVAAAHDSLVQPPFYVWLLLLKDRRTLYPVFRAFDIASFQVFIQVFMVPLAFHCSIPKMPAQPSSALNSKF